MTKITMKEMKKELNKELKALNREMIAQKYSRAIRREENKIYYPYYRYIPINYIVPMDLNYVHNVQQVKKW